MSEDDFMLGYMQGYKDRHHNLEHRYLEDYEKPETIQYDNPYVRVICSEYEVTPMQLLGKRRIQRYVLPRWVLFYLLRESTKMSYPELGKFLGKDHTTIGHGIREIEALLSVSSEFGEKLSRIKERVSSLSQAPS